MYSNSWMGTKKECPTDIVVWCYLMDDLIISLVCFPRLFRIRYNPLLISTISAALFVISHYVIFPQALWYGLFVVAIIVVGILYWKQKKEIAAMHVISSIIIGSLLAELCQGFYNYYYGEYF